MQKQFFRVLKVVKTKNAKIPENKEKKSKARQSDKCACLCVIDEEFSGEGAELSKGQTEEQLGDRICVYPICVSRTSCHPR
jgi:hypothetical protein